MPPDPIALARAAYNALNDRDLDTYLTLIDPEVEFTSLIAEAESRTYRGHDGVREWWEELSTPLGGLRIEARSIELLPSQLVLAELLVSGEVEGVSVSQPMWHVARVRDGRALWWAFGRTREQALAAAAEHDAAG